MSYVSFVDSFQGAGLWLVSPVASGLRWPSMAGVSRKADCSLHEQEAERLRILVSFEGTPQ